MMIDKDHKPPIGGMGGSIHDWYRSLDPWHRDGFPDEFADQAPHQEYPRREGWAALDAWGNPIGWVPDGFEIKGD